MGLARPYLPLLAAAAALAGGAGAAAAGGTKVVVYSPFGPGVRVVATASGYCWVGSNLTPRRDAWRCFRGNEIHDPCYSGGGEVFVACPLGFPSQRVLRLRLTKPLPLAQAGKGGDPTRGEPLAVQLADGRRCGFLGGATAGIHGMRVNYGCVGGGYLVGDVRRGRTWTIRRAKALRGPLSRVAIAIAWY